MLSCPFGWYLLGSNYSICSSVPVQVSTLVGAAAQSTCDTEVSLGSPSSPASPSSAAFKAWSWPLAAVPRCAGQIQMPKFPGNSRSHYFASVCFSMFLLFIGSRHDAPSHEQSCRNWQGSFASSNEAEVLGTGWHNSTASTDVRWLVDSGEGNGQKIISSDSFSMFEHLNTQLTWRSKTRARRPPTVKRCRQNNGNAQWIWWTRWLTWDLMLRCGVCWRKFCGILTMQHDSPGSISRGNLQIDHIVPR